MISEIMKAMIAYAQGNIHDITHFMNVYAYAHVIAEGEQVCHEEMQVLEIAAITHDIACPLCREKYGNTNGKYQEIEGERLARDFLAPFQLPEDMVSRVVYLVGHHHTYQNVDGMDYQILLEADYLANAMENHYSARNAANMLRRVFKTETGSALLKALYQEGL